MVPIPHKIYMLSFVGWNAFCLLEFEGPNEGQKNIRSICVNFTNIKFQKLAVGKIRIRTTAVPVREY